LYLLQFKLVYGEFLVVKRKYTRRADELRKLHRLLDKSEKLPPETVRKLIPKARCDPSIREKVVGSELNLVMWFVYKMEPRAQAVCVDLEELFQAGVVGLLEAIDRFELERNKIFHSYAYFWVRSNMQKAIKDGMRSVSIHSDAYRRAHLPEDSVYDAERYNEDISRVNNSVSLNQAVRLDDERTTYEDIIGEGTENDMIRSLSSDLVHQFLETLTPKERRFFVLKYLSSDEILTNNEIGMRNGVTRETARPHIVKAKEKLEAFLKSRGIIPYGAVCRKKRAKHTDEQKEKFLDAQGVPKRIYSKWKLNETSMRVLKNIIPLAVEAGVLVYLDTTLIRRARNEELARKFITRLQEASATVA